MNYVMEVSDPDRATVVLAGKDNYTTADNANASFSRIPFSVS